MTEDFIRTYDDALDSELCTHLIKKFSEYEKMGLVLNRKSNMGNKFKYVQDSNYVLMHELNIDTFLKDEVFQRIKPSINDYMNEFDVLAGGMAEMQLQQLKMQRYKKGQGFHEWHCEVTSSVHGHRVFNWQLFLNDVNDGGETEFLYLNKRIKPKMGTMLIFPSYFTHTHRGNCPIGGEKYILNGWVNFV